MKRSARSFSRCSSEHAPRSAQRLLPHGRATLPCSEDRLGAVLDSVDRAQPFGPAPDAILSSDGLAYLQWEFQRNEIYACSTMLARPYVLARPFH